VGSDDQDVRLNKDSVKYWKDKIYHTVSFFLIFCGTPLLMYGSYMFYIGGYRTSAAAEFAAAVSIPVVTNMKSLSMNFKKLFVIAILYFISVLILVNTGAAGAGMVCIALSLVLAGCLLDRRQLYQIMFINILTFTVITILIMSGNFDGTPMETYKSVWLINAMTTQSSGILMLSLMRTIYKGLENQTRVIKESRDLLIASDLRHKAMTANIADVIAISDEKGFINYISSNMEQKCGWSVDKVINKHLWGMFHFEDRDRAIREFQTLLKRAGMEKTIYVRCIDSDETVKHIELTAVNLINNPDIKGILINFHDITEQKLREEKIMYLNYHDKLTGLYNRTYFEQQKISLDTAIQFPVSIIIGDINGLKIINDSLGHAEGDKVLITTAMILKGCCDKDYTIARIGGDEFAIILPNTDCEDAVEVVKKINLAYEEHNKDTSSDLHYTSISLGYASKTNAEESLGSVQKNAEENMYKHKLLESRSLYSSIISSIKTALHEKSQETEEHAQRLVKLSKAVAKRIGLADEQVDALELFSALHDIGKIGINDQILNKPDRLTEEEWIEMKKHSEIGYRIAMASPELIHIAEYILTHHERFDGNGYPRGIGGDKIPLLSRIVSVVDAYDAMTEDRPYRKGMSKEAAVAEIMRNSGKQFDPRITEIFVDIILKS
jgi:diguanylate cyclase (GGDEF)-like protein/PAS domain S-box-containing protein